MDNGNFPVPLYHGTSTLFLEGIVQDGLAGKNPIAEWRVLEFAAELLPFVRTHLSGPDQFAARAGSFEMMVRQTSEAMNFQHGDTYLSPSASTAVRYAVNKRYGSELLTYCLDFLQLLVNQNTEGVRDDLYRRFPQIFAKLDISVAPILIRAGNVPLSYLVDEWGRDASQAVAKVMKVAKERPQRLDQSCQQCNFRLCSPISADKIEAWLIAVKRWDPFMPKYALFPIDLTRKLSGIAGFTPGISTSSDSSAESK
jgi:hypothetical protein